MRKEIMFFAVIIMVLVSTAYPYVVKAGDTAYSIARTNGISVETLVRDNPHISDITKLHIGDVLHIGLDMERLFSAFVYVESRGRDNAVGDNGNAVGCIQMWPIMVDEVNRLAKTAYTYSDRLNRSKCKEMFELLMKYKKVKTLDQAIRVWNPGSSGKAYRKAYAERR